MEIKVWILAGLCSFLVTILIIGLRSFLKKIDVQTNILGDIRSALAVQKKEGEHLKENIKKLEETQKDHSKRIRNLEIRGA